MASLNGSLLDRTEIPDIEVEIAADAIRKLWECDRNQRSIQETGYGASFTTMAVVALEAAAKVRGKTAAPRGAGGLH